MFTGFNVFILAEKINNQLEEYKNNLKHKRMLFTTVNIILQSLICFGVCNCYVEGKGRLKLNILRRSVKTIEFDKLKLELSLEIERGKSEVFIKKSGNIRFLLFNLFSIHIQPCLIN